MRQPPSRTEVEFCLSSLIRSSCFLDTELFGARIPAHGQIRARPRGGRGAPRCAGSAVICGCERKRRVTVSKLCRALQEKLGGADAAAVQHEQTTTQKLRGIELRKGSSPVASCATCPSGFHVRRRRLGGRLGKFEGSTGGRLHRLGGRFFDGGGKAVVTIGGGGRNGGFPPQ